MDIVLVVAGLLAFAAIIKQLKSIHILVNSRLQEALDEIKELKQLLHKEREANDPGDD